MTKSRIDKLEEKVRELEMELIQRVGNLEQRVHEALGTVKDKTHDHDDDDSPRTLDERLDALEKEVYG